MSKEKTPMQQLLDKLEYAKNKMKEDVLLVHPQYSNGVIDTLTNVINDIELQMIPIEKKLIIDTIENCMIIKQDMFMELGGKMVIKSDTPSRANLRKNFEDDGAYADQPGLNLNAVGSSD